MSTQMNRRSGHHRTPFGSLAGGRLRPTLAAFAILVMLIPVPAAADHEVWDREYDQSPDPDQSCQQWGRTTGITPDGATLLVAGFAYPEDADCSLDDDGEFPVGPSPHNSYVTVGYDAATGVQLWANDFDNGDDNVLEDLVVAESTTAPSGYAVYVTGTSSTSSGDMYLTVAYDARTGDELWNAGYAGGTSNQAVAIDASPQGDLVFVTGYSTAGGVRWNYATVAYETATGSLEWDAFYDFEADDIAMALTVVEEPNAAPNTNYALYVTGRSEDGGGATEWDYATVAYDPHPAATVRQLWSARYDHSAAHDHGGDISWAPAAAHPTGEQAVVYVTGWSGWDSINRRYDYATLAYQAIDGALVWDPILPDGAARFDHSQTDVGVSLATAPTTNPASPSGWAVYVTGWVVDPSGGQNAMTIAYDAHDASIILWSDIFTQWPTWTWDIPLEVVPSPTEDAVYVTGWSWSPDSLADYATIKYDGNGAQEWLHLYDRPTGNPADPGEDLAEGVTISPDGSMIFATGRSSAGFQMDIATVAIDAVTGSTVWEQQYSRGDGSEQAAAMAVSPTGGRIFVTGASWDTGLDSYEYGTVAYNALTGTEEWRVRWSSGGLAGHWVHGSQATAIAVSPDGSTVFVTGGSWTATGSIEVVTFAYDAITGFLEWQVSYDRAGGYDRAVGIEVDPNGNRVYVAATTWDLATGHDISLLTYDASNGALLNDDHHSGSGPLNYDVATSLAVHPDDIEVYAVGRSWNDPPSMGGTGTGFDYAAARFSSAGILSTIWSYCGADPFGTCQAGFDDPSDVVVVQGSIGYQLAVTGRSWNAGSGNLEFATAVFNIDALPAGAYAHEMRDSHPIIGSVGPSEAIAMAGHSDSTNQNPLVLVTGRSWNGVDYDYVTRAYLLGAGPGGPGVGGQTAWTDIWNGGLNDEAAAVTWSPDGSEAYVTGKSFSAFGYVYTTRAMDAASGVLNWHRASSHSFTPQDDDVAVAIGANPLGQHVYVTGTAESASDGPIYWTTAICTLPQGPLHNQVC